MMDRPWSPIYFGSGGPGNPTELTAVHIGRAFGTFAVNCKFRWINRGGRAMGRDGARRPRRGAVGRAVPAGRVSRLWRRQAADSSRPSRKSSRASAPSIHSSSRSRFRPEVIRGRAQRTRPRGTAWRANRRWHGRIGGVICESMLSRQAIIFHSCVHRLVAHRRCARTRHHAPSARGHGQS